MNKTLKGDFLLFIATFFWGITFLVQKNVTDLIPAFAFTSARFFIGALILIPLALKFSPKSQPLFSNYKDFRLYIFAAAMLGALVTLGSGIQQWGLSYTSETNSGFITTFYVILTPIITIFLGRKVERNIWVAAMIMLIGLYFLSSADGGLHIGSESFKGDALTLLCSIFWAFHVISLGYFVQKIPPLWLAIGKNMFCAFFALIISFSFEPPGSFQNVPLVWKQILWAGIGSVAIGFTCQILGQQYSPPSHAVIILSLEAVIAAIAAMIYYKELMSAQAVFGAFLMFSAVLIAEAYPLVKNKIFTKKSII